MTQFVAQGRLKPLLTAEGISISSEPKERGHYIMRLNLGAPDGQLMSFHKPRLMFLSSALLFSPFLKKTTRLSAGVRLSVGEDAIYDDYGGAEIGIDSLAYFKGLVLDVSYRPINVVCWKRAICLKFLDKADVLEYYDQTVNSPGGSYNIPAVLRVPQLLQLVKRKKVKNILNRQNIFHRDCYSCQYCSSKQNLTIDHVLPVARGGKWEWENLVTACDKCNFRKGRKTLVESSMSLIKTPKIPRDYDILTIPLTNAAINMLRLRKGTPQEWRQYL